MDDVERACHKAATESLDWSVKELRRREAEIKRLRSALERCVQVLADCDCTGEPHPTLDAAIAGIAKVAGEGPTMRAIVYAWRRHLEEAGVCQSALQNRFTVGPTLYTVRNALAVGRSALGAQSNGSED